MDAKTLKRLKDVLYRKPHVFSSEDTTIAWLNRSIPLLVGGYFDKNRRINPFSSTNARNKVVESLAKSIVSEYAKKK